MATFYLLPPRAVLEESLGALLGQWMPGLPLPADSWDVFAQQLSSAAGWPVDVYLVPRDDLPEGEAPAAALAAAFGAEPGDRVVDVSPARGAPRAWVLRAEDIPVAAATR